MGPLSLPVAALVLLAAVLHASWNAVAKSGRDPLLSLCTITSVGALVGLGALLVLPAPERAAWPYLAVGLVLHTGYLVFLLRMYRFGDLSQTYPVARGLAPLLVGAFSAAFAGEALRAGQVFGLVVACGSIASLAFAEGRPRGDARRALLAAAATGGFIGCYTFIDGQGVRYAGAPERFMAWSFLLDGIPMSAIAVALRGRAIVAWMRTSDCGRGLFGGLVATGAYGIVLWAMDHGAMAHVSALRETSVVFAALIGTRLLGEPFGRPRVLAAGGVALGVILLHVA